MADNFEPSMEQESKKLDVDVKVYPVRNDKRFSNILAYASATVGGCVAIKDNAPRITRQLQRWVNNKRIFHTVEHFADYISGRIKEG